MKFKLKVVSLISSIFICMLMPYSSLAETKSLPIDQGLQRLDVPCTPEDSVLYDFGDGAILRIPKILVSDSKIPKDPKQAVQVEKLSFVFQFPDMVQTHYPGAFDQVMILNKGVKQPDRFPVYVSWIFHQLVELGTIEQVSESENKKYWPDWRPKRMFWRVQSFVRSDGKKNQIPNADVTLVTTKYKGLREVHIPVTDKAYHDRMVSEWKDSGEDWDKAFPIYVGLANSPYELYMECSNPDYGDMPHECKAYVYIPSNHFQYRMIFPPEAVAHTDEVIQTINKLVDSWLQK